MMSVPTLHRALFAYLSLYAPLTALIGTRCYAGAAPSTAAFPYVTVHELGVGSHYAFAGPSATHDTQIQIDCWALAAPEAKQIARVIRNSLDGHAADWDGLEIDGVFIDAEFDAPEPAQDGSERVFHRRVLTLTCWHERDVPDLDN